LSFISTCFSDDSKLKARSRVKLFNIRQCDTNEDKDKKKKKGTIGSESEGTFHIGEDNQVPQQQNDSVLPCNEPVIFFKQNTSNHQREKAIYMIQNEFVVVNM
jgi:hypothetical protein